ncbi:cyclic nucleotide gated channel beta 1 [Branchiostoma belcheri]|nr:cyclic nucleotide gated channel beta 1 [Branchiostoma belcheri]
MADCDDDSTSSSSDEEYEKIVAQSAPEEEGVFNTLSALSKTLGHVNRGRKHDNYRHGRRHNFGGRDYDDPHGIMGYLDFLSRPKHMGVLKRHGLLKKLGPLGGVLLGMKGHHKGRQHGGGGRHGGRRRNHGNHDFGRLGNLGKGAWGKKGRRPRGGRGCYRGIRMHNFHGLGAVLGGEEYHSGSDSGDSD